MRAQLKDFRHKFGRDPKPGEPVFFDPDKDEPTPLDPGKLEADMLEVLRKTGTAPQIIYAYRKTGLLLVEGFEENYPPEAIEEWKAVIDGYFKLEREAGGDARAGMQPAGASGPEPRPTKIPELKDRPWTQEGSEAMEACLNVINEKIVDKAATQRACRALRRSPRRHLLQCISNRGRSGSSGRSSRVLRVL
jgi:hypothetical protein